MTIKETIDFCHRKNCTASFSTGLFDDCNMRRFAKWMLKKHPDSVDPCEKITQSDLDLNNGSVLVFVTSGNRCMEIAEPGYYRVSVDRSNAFRVVATRHFRGEVPSGGWFWNKYENENDEKRRAALLAKERAKTERRIALVKDEESKMRFIKRNVDLGVGSNARFFRAVGMVSAIAGNNRITRKG